MKKRIFSLLILAVLCVAVALPVSAVYPRLVDEADLLTDTQYNDLQSLLEEVSNRQRLDVVIVTVNSLGGKSPMQFADDYYDSHNYGFGADRDGVLLLVSMEDRTGGSPPRATASPPLPMRASITWRTGF